MRILSVFTSFIGAALLFVCLTPSAQVISKSGLTTQNPRSLESPHKGTQNFHRAQPVTLKNEHFNQARNDYGLLPLSFEVNQGQSDRRVKFLARGPGYAVFLTSTGAVLSLGTVSERKIGVSPSVISMNFVGGGARALVSGADQLPGRLNYFIGNDQTKWRAGITTYSKVRYRRVYPGIDVVYYGNQRQLEYDFVLAPGADPNRIRLAFDGASKIKVDENGDLVLSTAGGEVRQSKPVAYQDSNGVRREVSAAYRLRKGQISFDLGEFDKSLPLIIDPVLVYSSFLGGSSFERGLAVALDGQGNAYLTGTTSSTDFPLTGAIQNTRNGFSDAFVAKVNPAGTALVYSTYLGGNSDDTGFAIAVDSQGNAYVAGSTFSDTFPTTTGAVQVSKDTWLDGFISKLNPSGSALVYSTFLGGNNGERIFGIAVGFDGRATVVGTTESSRFSSLPFPTPRGGSAALKSIDSAGNWSGDDPQDTDFRGWEFWLNKLNQFNGNFVAAEMVKAFLVSIEYRQRFGP